MTPPAAATRCLVAAWLLALAGIVSAAAPPQTVYRCGPDGRVYSQTPCADGRAVTTEDSRSTSQQKAAGEVATREAQQARKLADERRQREAAAKNQQASGIKAPAPAIEGASAPARKAKGKLPPADPNMSPPMRVPAQPSASR
jgi:hypothetical protein